MTRLSLEEIQSALSAAGVEKEKQSKVVTILQQTIEEKEEDKKENAAPKQKNEFGVILFDANNELEGKEFTAAVYQIKQEDDHNTVLSRISTAAKEQNESARKKKNVITSIGEACEFLKRKYLKSKGVNVKTKNMVRVLVSTNKLV